jgi:hypothetical protein
LPAANKLVLSRPDIVFNTVAGGTLRDSAAIAVTATSGVALDDLRAVVRYEQGKPAGWLAVDLDHATLPATLSVRASSATMPAGEYTAIVELAAPGAAPESLSVTARAVSGPSIGLNAARICFTTTLGDTTHRDDVRVTSIDGSVISGLTRTIQHDAGQPTGWLSAEFDADVTPTRLRLLGQPAQLPVGTYTATVFVASPNAGNSPVPIRVTMTISPDPTRFLLIKMVTVGSGTPGNGRISAPGIDCLLIDGVQSGDCHERYAVGSTVHVTAIPATGNFFYEGQFGAAAGRSEFDVVLTENREIVAGFGPAPSTLHVVIRREGNYVGKARTYGTYGIQCDMPEYPPGYNQCDATYAGGTGVIALFSDADYGEQLLRWEGCTQTNAGCVAEATQPGSIITVTAVFGPRPSQRTIQVEAKGPGAVLSDDMFINTRSCPASYPQPCASSGHYYELGTLFLRLNAVPDGDAIFLRWSGCPSPAGTSCDVPVTEDLSVVAEFASNPPSPTQRSLQVRMNGSFGTVSSDDGYINCLSLCRHNYELGTVVRLTARPYTPYFSFVRWVGCPSAAGAACEVPITESSEVVAEFVAVDQPPALKSGMSRSN